MAYSYGLHTFDEEYEADAHLLEVLRPADLEPEVRQPALPVDTWPTIQPTPYGRCRNPSLGSARWTVSLASSRVDVARPLRLGFSRRSTIPSRGAAGSTGVGGREKEGGRERQREGGRKNTEQKGKLNR